MGNITLEKSINNDGLSLHNGTISELVRITETIKENEDDKT